MTNYWKTRQEKANKVVKLCSRLEEDLEYVAAKYKGLVTKDTFQNIAFDMWQQVADCDYYQAQGTEELL